MLEAKVIGLEGKVNQLEEKVRQLETQPIPVSTVQKSVDRNFHEMRAADASLISGFHWINPDGHTLGMIPLTFKIGKI